MNEKLKKLNQEIAKTEAKLRRAEHKENAGTPDKVGEKLKTKGRGNSPFVNKAILHYSGISLIFFL